MKILTIAVLILTVCCFVTVVHAEDLTGKVSVGAVAGGVFPKDSDIDDKWYAGGNLAYGINEFIALGVEVGYTSWDDEEGGTDYGDVQAIPLLVDVYLRYPIEMAENQVVPYMIGGIGVIFWDYEESSLLSSNGITVDMDSELGIKVGAGVDYFITENLAINVEGSYVWSDADMTVAAFGSYASATIDTDFVSVNGGLKYYF